MPGTFSVAGGFLSRASRASSGDRLVRMPARRAMRRSSGSSPTNMHSRGSIAPARSSARRKIAGSVLSIRTSLDSRISFLVKNGNSLAPVSALRTAAGGWLPLSEMMPILIFFFFSACSTSRAPGRTMKAFSERSGLTTASTSVAPRSKKTVETGLVLAIGYPPLESRSMADDIRRIYRCILEVLLRRARQKRAA